MSKTYNLGIDIGGTKCAVVLGSTEENKAVDEIIVDKIAFPTNQPRGWKKIIDEIIEKAHFIIENNDAQIRCIGISCGGPLDSKKGIVCCPPNLPDWDNVPICEIMKNEFNCPVILQNDANACAVAEWKYGAGQGLENMIFLTFGTGMGAGLILDGKLYSGTTDMAGEVGHIRLTETGPMGYDKNGSFEGYCSGGGIVNLAKLLINSKYPELKGTKTETEMTAKSLAQAAFTGDKFACEVYRICAEKLGAGLSILIDILNPDAVIIGSIFQRSQQLFIEPMTEVIEKEALSYSAKCCKILPAALGDNIGDLAALSLCL